MSVNDGLIPVLGDSTRERKVDLLNTSGPPVALVLDHTPTMSERPDCAVGGNEHITILVLLCFISEAVLLALTMASRETLIQTSHKSFIFLIVIAAPPTPPFQCLGVRPVHLLNLLHYLDISRHLLGIWHGHCSVVEAECVSCAQLFHATICITTQLLAQKQRKNLAPSLVRIWLLFGHKRWTRWRRSCTRPRDMHRRRRPRGRCQGDRNLRLLGHIRVVRRPGRRSHSPVDWAKGDCVVAAKRARTTTGNGELSMAFLPWCRHLGPCHT